MESIKVHIKQVILSGGSVRYPIKEKITDYFSDITISRINKSKYYNDEDVIYIQPYGEKFKIGDIDNSIDRFCDIVFSPKNIAFDFPVAMYNLNLDDVSRNDKDQHKKIMDEIKRIRREKKKALK